MCVFCALDENQRIFSLFFFSFVKADRSSGIEVFQCKGNVYTFVVLEELSQNKYENAIEI